MLIQQKYPQADAEFGPHDKNGKIKIEITLISENTFFECLLVFLSELQALLKKKNKKKGSFLQLPIIT